MTFKTLLFSGPFQLSIKKVTQSKFRKWNSVYLSQANKQCDPDCRRWARSHVKIAKSENPLWKWYRIVPKQTWPSCFQRKWFIFPTRRRRAAFFLLFFWRLNVHQKSKQNCENLRSTCWALQSFIKMCNRFSVRRMSDIMSRVTTAAFWIQFVVHQVAGEMSSWRIMTGSIVRDH